jgi:hypothetical protein
LYIYPIIIPTKQILVQVCVNILCSTYKEVRMLLLSLMSLFTIICFICDPPCHLSSVPSLFLMLKSQTKQPAMKNCSCLLLWKIVHASVNSCYLSQFHTMFNSKNYEMDTPRKLCIVCSEAVSTEYEKHRCDYLYSIEVGVDLYSVQLLGIYITALRNIAITCCSICVCVCMHVYMCI